MPPTGSDINREVIIYEPPWIFMSIKFRIHTHRNHRHADSM